jgi:toxin ParE1/3/4
MAKIKYNVKFTPLANEDLTQIYAYISDQLIAGPAATDLLEKIEINIMRLEEFPFSCSLVFDKQLRRKTTVN